MARVLGVGTSAVGLPASPVGGGQAATAKIADGGHLIVEAGSVLFELGEIWQGEGASCYLDAASHSDYRKSASDSASPTNLAYTRLDLSVAVHRFVVPEVSPVRHCHAQPIIEVL
jgi:hypothetical protein